MDVSAINNENYGKLNSVFYTFNTTSRAYSLPDVGDGIKIKMGMAEQGKASIKGCQAVLAHELLHAIGFQHKDGGLIKTRPKYYNNADQTCFNRDDIHGMDVVYKHDSKYKIHGYVGEAGVYQKAEAYIINKHNDLVYQTPVDRNGYYEFRLRRKLFNDDMFRLLS